MRSTTTSIMAGVIAALLLAQSLPAGAQSFNCRYARKPDEIAICQTPELARLDEVMASQFYHLLERYRRFGDWRTVRLLRRTQDAWLRWRHTCGYNVPCIRRRIHHRMRELAGY